MSKKKYSNSAGAALCTAWILTAIAAVCVTFIYFGKLGKLYASAKASEPVLVPVEVSENGTIIVSAEKTAEGLKEKEEAFLKAESERQVDEAVKPDTTAADAPIQIGGDANEPAVIPETPAADAGQQDVQQTGTAAEATGSTYTVQEEQPVQEQQPVQEEQPVQEQQPAQEQQSAQGTASGRIAQVRQTPDDNGKVCYFSSGRVLDPSKPMIAMTFDDGPSTRTEKILEALKKVDGRATFFMVGYQVENYKKYVQMVYEAGCEIGNHTLGHPQLTSLGEADLRHQIYDNEAAIRAIVPVDKLIVRPPYGNVNDTMRSVIDRPMFNWSVDSRDWETRDADMIVAQVKQDARDGYVILMHDIYDSTMNAAIRLIPWLTEQGYQLVTVSEMFELREGGVKEGSVYRFTNPAD